MSKKNVFAFTLIELIVVITIIGILTAILVVTLGDGRTSALDARRKADVNQLSRQVFIHRAENPGTALPEDTCNINNDCPENVNTMLETASLIDDPIPLKSYVYSSDGNNFKLISTLDDGTIYCFNSITGRYGTTDCAAYHSPVNGVCGTAVREFASGDDNYGAFTQCDSGTPSSAVFPEQGGSASWNCLGSYGGINSEECTATRAEAVFEEAICYPVEHNSSKVLNGQTVWCDNSGGMWTDNRGSMNTANGTTHCNGLTYAGVSDWALPTVTQLNQCWSATNCRVPQSSVAFWSSTVYPDWTEMNWYVNLGQDGAGYNGANFRTTSYSIRCRRTSPTVTNCTPADYNSTKVVAGDTVYCDNQGGMWSNDRGSMSWTTGRDHCSGLTYAGQNGWSLATIAHLNDCYNTPNCRGSTVYWAITLYSSDFGGVYYYLNMNPYYQGANTPGSSYQIRCRLGQ